jgi:hypothetical protein
VVISPPSKPAGDSHRGDETTWVGGMVSVRYGTRWASGPRSGATVSYVPPLTSRRADPFAGVRKPATVD